MGYLEDFQIQINDRNFHKFFQLWEEYCTNTEVHAEELLQILKMIKDSDFAKPFGQFVETALPMWQSIQDEKLAFEVIKVLMDLETTNSPILADTAYHVLETMFPNDPLFADRIRLVGLRDRNDFQGAVSNYALLAHMDKSKFVFHKGGWGTGEIMDLSPIREQLTLEFENLSGLKHLTFKNAFNTLEPLPDDHFLARRFSNPDLFEQEARQDPVMAVKLLLRDLGPKTAAEIKEEMCDWVIPEEDWSRWWQTARARIKKDTMIASPARIRNPFRLREAELTHEDRLYDIVRQENDAGKIIQTCYNFVRDFPNILKKDDLKLFLQEKLSELLTDTDLPPDQKLQIHLFLENLLGYKITGSSVEKIVQELSDIEDVINTINIVALKKRALVAIKQQRKDWAELFLSLLFSIQETTLRDHLIKELNQGETRKALDKRLLDLAYDPISSPEVLVWYFQKIIKKDERDLPFSDKAGQCLFLDAFLVLLHKLESIPSYRDMVRKMYNLLSGKRYAVIRSCLEGTTLEFAKEFLLLASKCHSFNDQDRKTLRSLVAVVHPSLAPKKTGNQDGENTHTIWTTEAGYLKTQERIKHLGTVEVVENAREVEEARALGDLRENAEYKSAVERRSRLQGELKHLAEQLNRARIITKDDIDPNEVSIGSIVDVEDTEGQKTRYTILGPWDADPDANILSFQSRLAEAMIGHKAKETFTFRDNTFKIVGIESFL